ncbi:MAG: transposase [Hyphomicrobiales bacterium]|nr:transposase [Hyphomicrobiales bacterium]MDE2115904.1 transposase [Hyphomicrobiales bacterium]
MLAAPALIADLPKGAMLLADKGYDAFANIPPKSNRKDPICFNPWLYRARNLVERFFNKIKHFPRIATRQDKHGTHYLAARKLVCVRLLLRFNESTG